MHGQIQMTNLTLRQKLDNIEAAIVEDILALSDEELYAELKENGEDPEEYARMGAEILEAAIRNQAELEIVTAKAIKAATANAEAIPTTCATCEFFDGGGIDDNGRWLEQTGDCHNRNSPRFQTSVGDVCEHYFRDDELISGLRKEQPELPKGRE
jgi:hypothetical protein